jgi:arylsulfatase A-like enzyme
MKLGLFIAGIVLFASAFAPSSRADGSKPNIIFILTDDLGYSDVGVLYQNNRCRRRLFHLPAPTVD